MNLLVSDATDSRMAHLAQRGLSDHKRGTLVFATPAYGRHINRVRAAILEQLGRQQPSGNSRFVIHSGWVDGWLKVAGIRRLIVQHADHLTGDMVEDLSLLSARLSVEVVFISNRGLGTGATARSFKKWTERMVAFDDWIRGEALGRSDSGIAERQEPEAAAADPLGGLGLDDLSMNDFLVYLWDLHQGLDPAAFAVLEQLFWATAAQFYDWVGDRRKLTAADFAGWVLSQCSGLRFAGRLTVIRAAQLGAFGAGWLVETALERLMHVALLKDNQLARADALAELVATEICPLRAAVMAVMVITRLASREVVAMQVKDLVITADKVQMEVRGGLEQIPEPAATGLRAYAHWRVPLALDETEPLWLRDDGGPITVNYLQKILLVKIAMGLTAGPMRGLNRYETGATWASQYGVVVSRIANIDRRGLERLARRQANAGSR